MNIHNSKKDILSKTAQNLGFNDFSSASIFAGQSDDELSKLEPDQRQFLRLYKQWIRKFSDSIKKQTDNPKDLLNNKMVQLLSDESKRWTKHVKSYMQDPAFSEYISKFNHPQTV